MRHFTIFYIFFDMKERGRRRRKRRERDLSHTSLLPDNSPQHHGQTRLKPRAWNSNWASQYPSGTKYLCQHVAVTQGVPQQEAEWEVELRHNPGRSNMRSRYPNQRSNHCATALGLYYFPILCVIYANNASKSGLIIMFWVLSSYTGTGREHNQGFRGHGYGGVWAVNKL